MNFFKSVFSDDPDPYESEIDYHDANENESSGDSSRADSSGAGGWDIGGLWKSLSEKSESIIETYRRDLQEFGTGLKKEIEVAQVSLETVGHVIDQLGNTFVKGTAQIISHGKDTNLDSDNKMEHGNDKNFNSKRYSRFDAKVCAIQGDVCTYSEVPEDLDDYKKWKSDFSLEGKNDEMEAILRENEAMESVYRRVVPNTVDSETFWNRYYYRIYKFKKAEDVRARLVRRMSREEEELSWDVEDDDDDGGGGDHDNEHAGHGEPEVGGENKEKEGDSELQGGGFDANSVVGTKREELHKSGEEEKKDDLLLSKEVGNKKDESVEESKVDKNEEGGFQEMGDGSKKTSNEVDNTENRNDPEKKVMVERKDEDEKSPLVASQHSANEEEDLEWDEIEDLSKIDEKKTTGMGSPSKVDLQKRLSAAQEEEDLSWDIEDYDEPAKA